VGGDNTGKFHATRGNEERRRGGQMRDGVRACRSKRADQVDDNSRFLENIFSKLLKRVFSIDLSKFMGWQVF